MKTDKYDVIIIGSGLGGLVCGAILSKEGYKVCILEKNEQVGGNLQTFIRNGCVFDTGVHYVGGLDKGQTLHQIFNYLGIMHRLKLSRLNDDAFDVIKFKGDVHEYSYGMGYQKFKANLLRNFPAQGDVIEKYCADMQRICANFPMYNLSKATKYEDTGVFSIGMRDYLQKLTENKKLQAVLAGTNLLYAGVADKTPLYIHALVINSYIQSAYRFVDGGDQIGKQLCRVIKNNGGQIYRKAEVKRIVVEDEKAVHVQMANGRKLFADNYISNLHPVQTFEMTETPVIKTASRNRIKNLENSVSAFVLYVVFNDKSFPYLDKNYYYHDGDDVWHGVEYTEETWPYTYAIYGSTSTKAKEDYSEGLSIMCYMRYSEVKQWEGSVKTTVIKNERCETYDEFKKRKAEKLLDMVEKQFPGFRSHIKAYYTSTPLTFRDYIGTGDGSMYGILKDYNNPAKTVIGARTKIPNLLLTGQNVNLHGILGVTVSAVLTSAEIIGREKLIDKILDANKN